MMFIRLKVVVGRLVPAMAALMFLVSGVVQAADFTVTSPGVFAINGTNNNPTITLTRGRTYVFTVTTASVHPFQVATTANTQYNTGLSANNISSGTINWTVATNAPSTLRYRCSVHGFFGTINVVNAPLPPTVRVLSVSLSSSNVTIKSTGTNGWNAIPEFTSNLVGTISWTTVPGYTNALLNGTNTTVFNRLEPICGSNVYLRVRNTQ
jgi:hypothetical protein